MAIPFTQIPASLLVPGMYQEIDNSLAGSTGEVKRVLIIGTKTAKGTAEVAKPVQVTSVARAKDLGGNGSPLAIMAETFLAKNKTEQLWLLPVVEPAGTKWTKTFVVSASSSGAGVLSVAVNGKTANTAVKGGDSAQTIAASITALINGMDNCAVEAETTTDDGVKITVTSLCNGTNGNCNRVQVTATASGVTISAGETVAGEGTADLTEALQKLGTIRYQYVISEFADEANMHALGSELTSRYSAMRQIGGRAFVCLSGIAGDYATEDSIIFNAAKQNNPHLVLIPHINGAELPCVFASAFCASVVRLLADDPSANTYDTEVPGITAPEIDFDTRQKLLEAGVSTYRLDATGTVLVERIVTSYTENTDGEKDTSYLDIQVVETIDAVRTKINAEARKRFRTWKLSSTNENFGPGSKVMSPGVWRSFLAEMYQEVFIQTLNWCQDFESYKNSIIVAVKADSKTRLEYSHRPVLIGQFYIGAGLNQFK